MYWGLESSIDWTTPTFKSGGSHLLFSRYKEVLETEIYDAKQDLKAIGSKLKIAYEYEDELVKRGCKFEKG